MRMNFKLSDDMVAVTLDEEVAVTLDKEVAVTLKEEVAVTLEEDVALTMDEEVAVSLDEEVAVTLEEEETLDEQKARERSLLVSLHSNNAHVQLFKKHQTLNNAHAYTCNNYIRYIIISMYIYIYIYSSSTMETKVYSILVYVVWWLPCLR